MICRMGQKVALKMGKRPSLFPDRDQGWPVTGYLESKGFILSVRLLVRNRVDELKNINKGQKDIRIPLDGGIILGQRLQLLGAFFNPLNFISDLLIHFCLLPSCP